MPQASADLATPGHHVDGRPARPHGRRARRQVSGPEDSRTWRFMLIGMAIGPTQLVRVRHHRPSSVSTRTPGSTRKPRARHAEVVHRTRGCGAGPPTSLLLLEPSSRSPTVTRHDRHRVNRSSRVDVAGPPTWRNRFVVPGKIAVSKQPDDRALVTAGMTRSSWTPSSCRICCAAGSPFLTSPEQTAWFMNIGAMRPPVQRRHRGRVRTRPRGWRYPPSCSRT